ncbi:MAG: family 43 glycosylhydrolase [Planctomycetes bacterium]|nr:family 43 glycosylhydrolase [Planctomycetota bacterium]
MLQARFSYRVALAYEPGVTRRDPSPVIRVGLLYYVWYSKATVDESGYFATLWYATSPDGIHWTEQGEALGTGGKGQWDEHAVFTPTILVAKQRYYIFYTAVPEPFTNDDGGPNATPTAIGVACADSPDGPWAKFHGNPVLRPGPPGHFDSHRVDDGCLIVRDGKYRLYYKGREKGLPPAETKMGLAVATHPTGPYVKSNLNPIVPSGHEVCVWPHGLGVAAMISSCGPEANTIQYSPDGLHFTRQASITPPRAPGPYRADHYRSGYGPGITWGISQDTSSEDRPFLVRFDCDLRA